ncbi:MAG: putative glucose-6-phosphate 1-epimerase [Pedosphaera sp.]|nr:putative glucose-6-phosphate 1-epimerase [Pedosphaera sp.]
MNNPNKPWEREAASEVFGRVNLMDGQGGLPMIEVHTQWSTAEIYLQGAHVTRFQKKDEPPLLFLSQASRFAKGQAIRGGIPIILPWFGARDGAPAHGFARISQWELKEITASSSGCISLRFRMPEPTDSAGFGPFVADYVVTVGEALELRLMVANTSPDRELSFEDCLHTYFTVGDISGISVVGLKNMHYLDKVQGYVKLKETNDAIKVDSEVDRVYVDTAGPVEIHDAGLKRKIMVEKEGSASTVVWNPWIAKSKQMADFGDEEYHTMICVESGNVAQNKITLAPGKSKSLSVKLSSVAL